MNKKQYQKAVQNLLTNLLLYYVDEKKKGKYEKKIQEFAEQHSSEMKKLLIEAQGTTMGKLLHEHLAKLGLASLPKQTKKKKVKKSKQKGKKSRKKKTTKKTKKTVKRKAKKTSSRTKSR